MASLQSVRKSFARYFTDPVVTVLEKTHITPNTVTIIGTLITIAAAVLVSLDHLFAAGFVVLFAGLFDMFDGALARRTNQVTRFGGVLDSTLDRLSEAAILIGITAFYTSQQNLWGVAVAGMALISSQLVSYIRARAEAIGINCEVGVFTRPERVVILSIGLLLGGFNNVLLIALIVIAVLSFTTAGQRLMYVKSKLKDEKSKPEFKSQNR